MTDQESITQQGEGASVSSSQAPELCYRAFELIYTKRFDEAESLVATNMAKETDPGLVALYHSVLGVLYKAKGEPKEAWRHYERAEKLLPDDPAIKLITARLLIDHFGQHSKAIKKAKRVLELMRHNAVFSHQAFTTMGLAHCARGEKAKALEMLDSSVVNKFLDFISGENIDLTLVEALVRKGWGLSSCAKFLGMARDFCASTKEESRREVFERLIDAFVRDYGPEAFAENQSANLE